MNKSPIKAWLINLDCRNDRLQQFNALTQPNLEIYCTRVSAINGAHLWLDSSLAERLSPALGNSELETKRGVIACALSHFKTWKAIIAQSQSLDDWHLVLEDDARFCNSHSPRKLKELAHLLPGDGGLVFLDDLPYRINKSSLLSFESRLNKISFGWRLGTKITCFAQSIYQRKKSPPFLLLVPTVLKTTVAYFITARMAAFLLQKLSNDIAAIDVAMRYASHNLSSPVKPYYSVPSVFTQHQFLFGIPDSDVTP